MKVINPDDKIKYLRFKKDGFWFRFVGYVDGKDVVKREHDGKFFHLTASQVRKIDAEEVDGEVVEIVKKDNNQLLNYYRKKYKTIKIIWLRLSNN